MTEVKSPSLEEFIIERVRAYLLELERQNTPRGIIDWPQQHAAICKAAERVTRQQRRHTERQAAKRR